MCPLLVALRAILWWTHHRRDSLGDSSVILWNGWRVSTSMSTKGGEFSLLWAKRMFFYDGSSSSFSQMKLSLRGWWPYKAATEHRWRHRPRRRRRPIPFPWADDVTVTAVTMKNPIHPPTHHLKNFSNSREVVRLFDTWRRSTSAKIQRNCSEFLEWN